MKKIRATLNTLGSTTLNGVDREDLDFYQTPVFATKTLLKNQMFPIEIWEPMAGNGAISKVLTANGFNVYSTDIVERKFKLNNTFDYFKDGEKYLDTFQNEFSIITNPPYEFANQFLKFTLEKIQPLQCAVFLPIRYLEGQKRYDEIYSIYRPYKVLIYTKRLGCYTEQDVMGGKVTDKGVGSAVAYMWLIFDRETMLNKARNTEIVWVN